MGGEFFLPITTSVTNKIQITVAIYNRFFQLAKEFLPVLLLIKIYSVVYGIMSVFVELNMESDIFARLLNLKCVSL